MWARADEHDLVVVASATGSHAALATARRRRGPRRGGREAAGPARPPRPAPWSKRAAAAGVMLSVFHNRRWDAEYLTLRRLVAEGALGDVARYESRFERWRPLPCPRGVARGALHRRRGRGAPRPGRAPRRPGHDVARAGLPASTPRSRRVGAGPTTTPSWLCSTSRGRARTCGQRGGGRARAAPAGARQRRRHTSSSISTARRTRCAPVVDPTSRIRDRAPAAVGPAGPR